ncbi:5HT-dro2A receptor [Culex quinquefasciatus]|uniref:5HT-dro2A receptor n=1 Tax=Culex quinquefasciatus TaxID=7176 RepID=B0WX35_CULQU|nr:5HT-dro2A receptor [Culex quinquefasciatus]|eukprot:XP_001861957.1 5HT-dro2A receptor [Culex quinquefasciatus]
MTGKYARCAVPAKTIDLASAGDVMTSNRRTCLPPTAGRTQKTDRRTGSQIRPSDSNWATVINQHVARGRARNVFVIAAILLERNLQSVANHLILSLAVADLLVACLVMPLGAVYEVSKEWRLGADLCDMWTSSDVLCCTASILHLVAIALDRDSPPFLTARKGFAQNHSGGFSLSYPEPLGQISAYNFNKQPFREAFFLFPALKLQASPRSSILRLMDFGRLSLFFSRKSAVARGSDRK